MTITALSWKEWDASTSELYLTIGDIIKLEAGAQLELLIQDRNVADSVGNLGHDDGQPRSGKRFFEGLTDTFTYKHGLTGVMKWHWSTAAAERTFTFELFSEKHQLWYPLNEFGFFRPEEVHWMDMPLTTLVGWRGPAMLWADLDGQPYIYTDAAAGFWSYGSQ